MAMSSDSIAPRVPVPPPLIYGAVLGLGLLFQHLCPIPVAAASIAPILEWLGAIVAACSGVLAAFTFCIFGRYRTTFRTDRQATNLVVAGPFRFTRNPLYRRSAHGHRSRGTPPSSALRAPVRRVLPKGAPVAVEPFKVNPRALPHIAAERSLIYL